MVWWGFSVLQRLAGAAGDRVSVRDRPDQFSHSDVGSSDGGACHRPGPVHQLDKVHDALDG
eukprot:8976105-Pyramimonas_sp.AAC.1